jgi:hypothetical protein
MSFEVLMLLFEKKEKLFLKIILCVDLEYLCSHEAFRKGELYIKAEG